MNFQKEVERLWSFLRGDWTFSLGIYGISPEGLGISPERLGKERSSETVACEEEPSHC